MSVQPRGLRLSYPFLVRKDSRRNDGDKDLGKNCHELQDKVIDSDYPEQVIERVHFLRWNEECTERKIVVQENKVDEENARDLVYLKLKGLGERSTVLWKDLTEMANSAPKFLLACRDTCCFRTLFAWRKVRTRPQQTMIPVP